MVMGVSIMKSLLKKVIKLVSLVHPFRPLGREKSEGKVQNIIMPHIASVPLSEQLFSKCPSLQGETEQSGHFGWTIFFHLARLSGLARLLVINRPGVAGAVL